MILVKDGELVMTILATIKNDTIRFLQNPFLVLLNLFILCLKLVSKIWCLQTAKRYEIFCDTLALIIFVTMTEMVCSETESFRNGKILEFMFPQAQAAKPRDCSCSHIAVQCYSGEIVCYPIV